LAAALRLLRRLPNTVGSRLETRHWPQSRAKLRFGAIDSSRRTEYMYQVKHMDWDNS